MALKTTAASTDECTVPALAVDGLTFSFSGKPVLDDISCKIAPGRVTAIIGPNGAGKSTLAHLFVGFLKPDQGDILLQGRPRRIYTTAQTAAKIAFVPQFSQVGFGYSVRQIVQMGRWPVRPAGVWPERLSAEDAAAVDRAMWHSDVQHLAHRTFWELSGGERQRVVIARALAQESPIIILDEPTTGLDLWHQMEILGLLRSLASGKLRTIVVVTHDLNMALQHCDDAILLSDGRLAAAGNVQQVLTPEMVRLVYRVAVTKMGQMLHFSQVAR